MEYLVICFGLLYLAAQQRMFVDAREFRAGVDGKVVCADVDEAQFVHDVRHQ